MSNLALGWAKQQQAPTALSKAVLICLADYADADGIAWPKIKTLASEVQASPRTVQRCIRLLIDDGLIVSEPFNREDGGQTSNRYHLPLPGVVQQPAPHDNLSCPPRQPVVPPTTLLSPLNDPSLDPLPSDEGNAPAKLKARKKPSIAIPASFPPPGLIEEQRSRLLTEGYDLDLAIEVERFRNHAQQTARTCADWSAAFRNWIIKAKGWAPRRQSAEWDDDRWRAALAMNRDEGWWSDKLGPPPGSPGCRVPPHLAVPAPPIQDKAA